MFLFTPCSTKKTTKISPAVLPFVVFWFVRISVWSELPLGTELFHTFFFRMAPVRFGYGSLPPNLTVRAVVVFSSNASSGKGAFCAFQHSLRGWHSSGSGFSSWKTVPTVPVPTSVPGKTVPRAGTNRVFGKPCFGPPPKKGPFWRKRRKRQICILPTANKGFAPQTPKTTKMAMAGVTQEKAWFRKSRVCSSLNSDRSGFTTLIAWYNPGIPWAPLNRQDKEQVVFLGDGPGVPKMSPLALVQPQTCPSASLGLH